MSFEHETHAEFVRTRAAQLHRAWPRATQPAGHTGTLLIRLGRRLAAEPRASALAHEALPRC